MEIKMAENLRLETIIPFLSINHFQMHWKPNEHAVLSLEGCINNKIPYHLEQLYDSSIKLFLDQGDVAQPIFCGLIIKVESSTASGMENVSLQALSGSCLLDRKSSSSSFQETNQIYSDIVKQVVEYSGGKVICTIGKDRKIEKPLVQYNETTWEFVKRLASHLGTGIVPDVETGRPAFWFGMRNGTRNSEFSEIEYTAIIRYDCGDKPCEICYQVESRTFYKIGDQTSFLNETMIVVEVSAHLRQGELFFIYLLQKEWKMKPFYQEKFIGLSLSGTVLDTKDELIKIALDIDNGVSTGSYYYPWYPNTGNVLYALPEIGAKIELYFSGSDERTGFISECFPEKKKKYKYENRCFVLEDGNAIQLFDSLLCFSKGGGQSVTLYDGSITVGSSKQLQLSAEGKIRLKAKRISAISENEIAILKN